MSSAELYLLYICGTYNPGYTVVMDCVLFGTQKIKLTFFLQRKHTEFYRVLL